MITVAPVMDEDENLVGAVRIVRDIRAQAGEEALREREERGSCHCPGNPDPCGDYSILGQQDPLCK